MRQAVRAAVPLPLPCTWSRSERSAQFAAAFARSIATVPALRPAPRRLQYLLAALLPESPALLIPRREHSAAIRAFHSRLTTSTARRTRSSSAAVVHAYRQRARFPLASASPRYALSHWPPIFKSHQPRMNPFALEYSPARLRFLAEFCKCTSDPQSRSRLAHRLHHARLAYARRSAQHYDLRHGKSRPAAGHTRHLPSFASWNTSRTLQPTSSGICSSPIAQSIVSHAMPSSKTKEKSRRTG